MFCRFIGSNPPAFNLVSRGLMVVSFISCPDALVVLPVFIVQCMLFIRGDLVTNESPHFLISK